MFFEKELISKAAEILKILKEKQLKFAVAESCSGGLLSALFTEISGASEVFDCGFVTYSNKAKEKMLGVKSKTLNQFGAVSSEVAKEMALGALKKSNSNITLAITGIAGPNSDNTKKPVGLVYIAIAKSFENFEVKQFNFSGNRSKIRAESLIAAINLLSQNA